MKRGEIWWAELPDPVGSEPGYKRPIVVIQSNDFNISKISTVIVAIITSNLFLASAPGNVLLSAKASKLSKKSVVNISQLVTLDKSFLTDKIHTLSSKYIGQIDEGIRLVLNL